MTSAGQLMRAAWISAVDADPQIGQRPRPEPGPGQVLLAVRAAGVCHTDLHLLGGVPGPPPLPLVPGHEVAGEVVAVGAGVDGDVRVGERVLVYYYDGCHNCPHCQAGAENLCPAPRAKWGFDTDGGYAEFMTVAARCCVPLPDAVDYADAAVMGCSGTTALHAVRSVAAVRPGETVLVVGVGGIGLAVTQVAVLDGAEVVAVDTHQASLDMARQLGASTVVRATSPDAVLAAVPGVDVAIDTVGAPGTPGLCVEALRTGGRLVLIGYTGKHADLDVSRVVTREIVIRGSVGATLDDAREAVRLVGQGALRAVISRRYPLVEADRALRELSTGNAVGRLVLEP